MASGAETTTMKPKTLSASSLSVAEKCMARWKTEYIDRVRGPGGSAADLGTTCHAALEEFVTICYIADEKMPDEWMILKTCYDRAFPVTFGSDFSVPEYADGIDMLMKWHKQNVPNLRGHEILSTEKKETF